MSDQQSLWPLRLLAVVIAAALWLTTSFVPRIQELRVTTIQREVEATVSYRTPEGFVILNPEQTVTVNVRGPEEEIFALTSDSVDVAIPFPENAVPGPIEAAITSENVTVPPGIDVVDIVPSTLSLLIDRRVRRMVPVQVEYRGEPLVGFRVDEENSTAIPPEVQVDGPQQQVDNVRTVTALVDVTNRARNFESQVATSTDNSYVRVLQPNLITVQVRMVAVDGSTNGVGLLQ